MVGWDLLTLGERWLCGGHLEAVQEVFALEERWWAQGMSRAVGSTPLVHPHALSCTPLVHPHAPHYTPLHPPVPSVPPYTPQPQNLTFPASTSSPVSASYRGMVTLQGKEGAEPGAPTGTAPQWMWGWILFPHWCTPQTPSWGSVGQDQAMPIMPISP